MPLLDYADAIPSSYPVHYPTKGYHSHSSSQSSQSSFTMTNNIHLKSTTRRQHINRLLTTPIPACTSTAWRQEYYRILWMMRELLDCGNKDVRSTWKMNVLAEALQKLHELDDPTSTPAESYKKDNNRWTEIMTRRIIAESLWDDAGVVTFYDCWDTLREGRSKAAALRLHEQVRICWQGVTDADLGTEFTLQC